MQQELKTLQRSLEDEKATTSVLRASMKTVSLVSVMIQFSALQP